LDLFALPL